ncbi:peptidoglycan editing factor PgeF [Polynucleobacter sp. MWH-UH25E]|uniref:peptidoglycan editing factor PgeF n=1 Tax=Polynucleobacter sp. MWH-UH25E TaxID=1855616 RepID=UPI001BFD60F9|nr:peptidoglycan editing factor PgeF [Polynucleobacter sp. MWH-UH25E]QWD61642.1 peptidoglycan editing factor PgeF [Polynucleobacter sp. MWH-UH25E]
MNNSATALKLVIPEWPAPPQVKSAVTTREGGISLGPYQSFNLGDHVGDDPKCVLANRALLGKFLPNEPIWLKQVHGLKVSTPNARLDEADAIVTNKPNEVIAIMTADCLPVLFTSESGDVIGAAHAGWRGLCNGVLENTVKEMQVLSGASSARKILAWLGPAIGPTAFEVGTDVLEAYQDAKIPFPDQSFVAIPSKPGKYFANLYLLARSRLESVGLNQIYGGDYCTVNQEEQFFSYRRDGVTGRFASLIWISQSK